MLVRIVRVETTLERDSGIEPLLVCTVEWLRCSRVPVQGERTQCSVPLNQLLPSERPWFAFA